MPQNTLMQQVLRNHYFMLWRSVSKTKTRNWFSMFPTSPCPTTSMQTC